MRTARGMIRRALNIAIDSDGHLLDCMGGFDPEQSEATQKDIDAYRKILVMYFGVSRTASEEAMDKMERLSIAEVISGRRALRDLDPA